jgi:hypothetical protein
MFIVIVTTVILFILFFAIQSNKKITSLQQHYHEALKGADKRAALDAGRAYYSALRKNKTLTVYDEQAITNDLSTMQASPVSDNHTNR